MLISIYKVLDCLTNFLIILLNLYYKAINPIIIECILPQCGFMAKFIDIPGNNRNKSNISNRS